VKSHRKFQLFAAFLLAIPALAQAQNQSSPPASGDFHLTWRQVHLEQKLPGQRFIPANPPLVAFDTETSRFCATDLGHGYLDNTRLAPCEKLTELYTEVTWPGMELWARTLILLGVFALLLTALLYWNPKEVLFPDGKAAEAKALAESEKRKRDPQIERFAVQDALPLGQEPEEQPHRLGRSVGLSLWTTIVGFSAFTWIASIYFAKGAFVAFLGASAAVLILLATAVLEGLEAAFSELKDKDPHQIQGSAARLHQQLRNMKTAFFETREWSIIALVVAVTLMTEVDPGYQIPGIGYVDSDAHLWLFGWRFALGHLVRIALSVILTTFPFVWLAQSPGKEVARKNSVQFLRYPFSHVMVFFLKRIIWPLMRRSGLLYPSYVADDVALRMLKRSQDERALLPSEYAFFIEGVAKYGYGVLFLDEDISIDGKGAITVKSRQLVYIAMPRGRISRWLFFEKGFADKVVENLSCYPPVGAKWWAYDIPLISEKVTDPILGKFAELVYMKEPENWKLPQHCAKRKADLFEMKITPSRAIEPETRDLDTLPDAEVAPSGAAATKTRDLDSLSDMEPTEDLTAKKTSRDKKKELDNKLKVELIFRENLPKQPAQPTPCPRMAQLILWEIEVKTNEKTIPLPDQEAPQKKYLYYKIQTFPLLRSTLSFTLEEKGKIFVESREEDHFTVTYRGVKHEQESKRFRMQERPDFEFPKPPAEIKSWSARFRDRLGRVFVSKAALQAQQQAAEQPAANTHNGNGAVALRPIPTATTVPGKQFTCYIDSPLVNAYYNIHLWIENEHAAPCKDATKSHAETHEATQAKQTASGAESTKPASEAGLAVQVVDESGREAGPKLESRESAAVPLAAGHGATATVHGEAGGSDRATPAVDAKVIPN
jgi:hypothetical protein